MWSEGLVSACIFPLRFDVQHNNFLNSCILMDFPIHIVTINMELSIETLITNRRQPHGTARFVLILANSADPDEMQHYAAFRLGPHCLPKYPFRGFQYTKS